MKAHKPTTRFWTVLVILNVLAIVYPLGLCLHSDSADGQLLATFALLGVGFFLAIGDTVGILLAYW
jgi:hypothetical protein